MQAVVLLILLCLGICMGAVVAAWQAWGGWGLLWAFGVVVGCLFVLRLTGGRLLVLLFTIPFRMKGKVLRGATVTVHDVRIADPPKPDEDDEPLGRECFDSDEEYADFQREMQEEAERSAQRRWYHVDVTIDPRPVSGDGFTLWEPGELVFVPRDGNPESAMLDDGADDMSELADYLIWDPEREAFVDDEHGKLPGLQRVRFHVGVDPHVGVLAFRYYFEQFGELTLPAS